MVTTNEVTIVPDVEGSLGAASAPDQTSIASDPRRSQDRRRQRIYRFLERRSGFNRREKSPILGTLRDHHGALLLVLMLINVFSIIDGYFTAAELGLGLATEGNPVLRALAERNPWYAVAVKLALVLAVTIGIWAGRKKKAVLVLSLFALALFAGMVVYHVSQLRAFGYL